MLEKVLKQPQVELMLALGELRNWERESQVENEMRTFFNSFIEI